VHDQQQQLSGVPLGFSTGQLRQRGAMRVFIVEDSANMQVALQDLVCSVTEADIVGVVASEDDAADWAQTNAGGWDVAIVDLTLDQGDGFSIVRSLKASPVTGTVIVFSAFVTDVIRRHCRALGADAVFHKGESRGLADFIEKLARV
jgi:DNA-binding NarL/FixJ family response regulator